MRAQLLAKNVRSTRASALRARPRQAIQCSLAQGQSSARSWSAMGASVAASIALMVLPANAQDADLVKYGAEVFTANCASCHTGGKNIIMPQKTLAKQALEEYLTGGFNKEAIIYQVTNGKGQMPAWGDSLEPEEIVAVAEYVYNQALTASDGALGWK